MGKKALPEGLRIDLFGWRSNLWHSNDKKKIRQFVNEDYNIEKLVNEFYGLNVIANITIERSNMNTVVTIHTHRPGLVAGEKGDKIKQLEKKLKKKLKLNIKVNIKEFLRPETSAKLIAEQIAYKIENQMNYKLVIKSILKNIERSIFVSGIIVEICGRINGSSIARTEKYKKGSVARQTFKSDVSLFTIQVRTKYGVLGVKVCLRSLVDNFKINRRGV